jgi:hypothetical protein
VIEDLTGNIRRVCDGLAAEIAKRVTADFSACDHAVVESHARQVLIDWFLGEFIPADKGG